MNRAASDKGEQEREQRFGSSFDWRSSGIFETTDPLAAWVDSCMVVHATLFVVCVKIRRHIGWIMDHSIYALPDIYPTLGQRVAWIGGQGHGRWCLLVVVS
jgi:hypothetical protein